MEWKETTFATLAAMLVLTVVASVGEAQLIRSSAARDTKSMDELSKALEKASVDNKHRMKFRQEMKESVGRGFWSECFKYKILDLWLTHSLYSSGSAGDGAAAAQDAQDGKLTQAQCSYTSPKGGELVACLELKGKNKAVLCCFDSRNWNNYPKKGVLVAWSEGAAEFLTPDQVEGISAEEWKEPATKVIGVKKPFHRTHQEAECAAYANPDAPEKDDVDYTSVYRKKGRVITFSAEFKGSRPDSVVLRFSVLDLTESEATVKLEALNLDGTPKNPKRAAESETVDLSDKNGAKPRGKRVKDSATEIEAAGRKWKVEKWEGKFSGTEQTVMWLSTEIPGLVIKAESENVTMVLKEFIDPEEK